MAASPPYKIFDPQGAYRGAVNELEAAAALMAFYGEGAQVRVGHSARNVLWHEGHEPEPAGESYDGAAGVMAQRERMLVAAGRA